MNIIINGRFASIDFTTASAQEIADFCIYDLSELINTVNFNTYKMQFNIDIDLYSYGGQCSWAYDVEDIDVCYNINNGVHTVLDFIGSAYDEITNKIDSLRCIDYMVEQFDAIPDTTPLVNLAELLDKLYDEINDECYNFVHSDWFEGRGL